MIRLTSPGPVIYTQSRLGRNAKPYTIYKLRTMTHDCERVSGVRWCVPGDPRVTRVGRLLRRLHIDELPQLVNVLRGDMSLVGPRPERPEIVERLEKHLPSYRERLGSSGRALPDSRRSNCRPTPISRVSAASSIWTSAMSAFAIRGSTSASCSGHASMCFGSRPR